MYGMNTPDNRWVAISREEYERQDKRIVFDDGYICPECGSELSIGITTPGYRCKNCYFHITRPEIDYADLYMALRANNGTAEAVYPVPDFVERLNMLIAQNPSHPLSSSIRSLIEDYKAIER